jgi:DivIVA domain-containing protein
MPSPQPMSALESLRTVEFRQTLRGYHIDDVDEYLERVAVEAEGLHEQLRQAHERVRQATERITQLESQRQGAPAQSVSAAESGAGTESLQRTLAMAQKFVEQTEAEAQAQAKATIEEAEQRARKLVEESEQRARTLAEESEKRLREEVARLEGLRGKLAGDVETISRHLETERARLRGALGEMLHWIDETLQPSATLKPPAPPSGPGPGSGEQRSREEATTVPPGPASATAPSAGPRPGALQSLAGGNSPNR